MGQNWNDVISSVKLKPGFRTKLAKDRDFSGGTLMLSKNVSNLVAVGFNDSVSSFKVSAAPNGGGGNNSELDKKCTPTVKLSLEDKNQARAKLFLDVSGANPEAFMQDIGRKVCRTLYQKASEVRDATSLELIIRYSPGDGADITVMISTDHLQNVKNAGAPSVKRLKASSSTR